MKAIQRAWERLSNPMRLYSEAAMQFPSLVKVDREEAITNMDLAFEAKLETFHTLYDVSMGTPGFKYFDHGDMSLLIVLRNAIHHWDHDLFESMAARLGQEGGLEKLAGAELMLAGPLTWMKRGRASTTCFFTTSMRGWPVRTSRTRRPFKRSGSANLASLRFPHTLHRSAIRSRRSTST